MKATSIDKNNKTKANMTPPLMMIVIFCLGIQVIAKIGASSRQVWLYHIKIKHRINGIVDQNGFFPGDLKALLAPEGVIGIAGKNLQSFFVPDVGMPIGRSAPLTVFFLNQDMTDQVACSGQRNTGGRSPGLQTKDPIFKTMATAVIHERYFHAGIRR
jgi:hypothetical protein